MGFTPQRGKFYRMPVFFGPTPGPRQWPAGVGFDFTQTPKRRVAGVSFLTSAAQLEAFLPPRFELWGDPLVTVDVHYVKEIGWLAGRGYNMCDWRIPVIYKGANGDVHGNLVMLRWENLSDPILSGREELGHNKVWAEIPEYRVSADGTHTMEMSWLGRPFMRLTWSGLKEDAAPPKPNPLHRGMISYKYVPATGRWGEADAEYATLWPIATTITTERRWSGAGQVEFLRATWEELPTLYHIVNAFADLEVKEWRGAFMMDQRGGASGEDTYRLE
jgi:hypothetical protein